MLFGVLSGFVCAFHPAAPGSIPKHTIYAYVYMLISELCGKDENKQREARIGPFLKK